MTGRTPVELTPPDVEEASLYLLTWFHELNMARSANGFGMNLLAYAEIDAWARLTKRAVTAWEVSVLKTLDIIYVNVHQAKP